MLKVLVLSVLVFSVATVLIAIGMLVTGRPFRRACCGGHQAAGLTNAHGSCPSCPEGPDRKYVVQLSVGSLKHSHPDTGGQRRQ